MSDALVVAFQSQLSVIMETILKSAMLEISRLVEDSFMEEVARGKQELELLLRRLQFSERKLKERERRGRCADCGRAAGGGERTAERPADTLTGEDALCFRLSLREQSEKRAPFNEVWRSTEATDEDSYSPTETHSQHAVDVHENSKNNNNILPNVAIMRIQEPRVSPPSKKPDLLQSRLDDVKVTELASSPGRGTMKPEQEPNPNPESVEIKEEPEMLPVWDFRDDEGPAEADPNRSGSWDHDETQVDHFPNLSDLDVSDPSSHLTSCSAQISQSIICKVEPGQSDLAHLSLAPVPDRYENGRSFDLCPGEKLFPRPHHFRSDNPPAHPKAYALHLAARRLRCTQCDETFADDRELTEHHRRRHSKERPHVCPTCGKAFTRFSNFKQHLNIHTHEKLFNCTQCGMRFKRSTHLRVHLRRHTRAGKSTPCGHCGKSFVCTKQLKGHLLRVHGMGTD